MRRDQHSLSVESAKPSVCRGHRSRVVFVFVRARCAGPRHDFIQRAPNARFTQEREQLTVRNEINGSIRNWASGTRILSSALLVGDVVLAEHNTVVETRNAKLENAVICFRGVSWPCSRNNPRINTYAASRNVDAK